MLRHAEPGDKSCASPVQRSHETRNGLCPRFVQYSTDPSKCCISQFQQIKNKIPLSPFKVSSFQWLVVQSDKRTSTYSRRSRDDPANPADTWEKTLILLCPVSNTQTHRQRKYCHFMGPFHKTNAKFPQTLQLQHHVRTNRTRSVHLLAFLLLFRNRGSKIGNPHILCLSKK